MPASDRSLPFRALVLTAGLGTRLRPLTFARAKAAVPVNGDPLAVRVVRWLAGHGIRDQVLNLHYKPETLTAVVGDGSQLGVRVRYSWENPVLGSAGGPRHALPLLLDGGAERFLLVNGDTLTDVDVPRLIQAHAATGALVTMAVIPNPAPEKYGGVAVQDADVVTRFTGRGSPEPAYHFIGVQVVEASVFASLPDGVAESSVGVVYPRLMAAQPGSIRAFVSDASFRDIGTPEDCLETSLALAQREGDRLIGRRCRIDPTARLSRTAVWDDVVVGPRARLTDCIVADGVEIPPDTELHACAVVRAAQADAPADGEWIQDGLLLRRFRRSPGDGGTV